jgi:glycosyltransferase involved in cell wall biosynthesis
MRILHVSASLSQGGAARAAQRILSSQLGAGMNVEVMTLENHTFEKDVTPRNQMGARNFRRLVVPRIDSALMRMVSPRQSGPRTSGLFTSIRANEINKLPVDVINLHWVMGGMLSIQEIAKLDKPVVWTLHDCWPLLGTQHYSEGSSYWKEKSYLRPRQSNSDYTSTWLDQVTTTMKDKLWKSSIRFVAPSNWMRDQVRQSRIGSKSHVEVIPYPIDSEFWKPMTKKQSREILGWSERKFVVLFGAIAATTDKRKGYDLFVNAIQAIAPKHRDVEIVVFGSSASIESDHGLNVRYLGHLDNDSDLRLAYSAADVFVLTSREDNLPNTAIEASACGTPVVAFDVGGLRDIVSHKVSGYLATPFEVASIAEGIEWVRESAHQYRIHANARNYVLERLDPPRIARSYQSLYKKTLEK